MKQRIDLKLVEQGLATSREQAQRLIEKGGVKCNGVEVKKASQKVDCESILSCDIIEPYVSRGAYKLLEALESSKLDLSHKIAIDIGASTGGFTDLLLQKGIQKVYAIDCGSEQLHEKLRHDSRVISMEKVNARYLDKQMFKNDSISIAVMDVSFISVTLIFDSLKKILDLNSTLFILVKPQFEAGKEHLGKKGVVKSENVQLSCVQKVIEIAQKTYGFTHIETFTSPIKGPEGNQEYMVIFKN